MTCDRAAIFFGCAAIVVALALPGTVALVHEGEEETSAKELVLQAIALLRGQPEQTEETCGWQLGIVS